MGFPNSSVVENLPAKAEDRGDVGSVPGSGRSPGEGNGNHSSVPAEEIPWRKEPDKLQPMGSPRVRHD